MIDPEPRKRLTRQIAAEDPGCGFRCGKHPLDDYFRRHALRNDAGGIGKTYVLEPQSDEELIAGLPHVIGFYTLSMAAVVSANLGSVMAKKLPHYPMPVALIGRLAVDERARGRRLGEALLIDALQRVVDAADIIGCLGVIVHAKDEEAECFYGKYDFATVEGSSWPHTMFLPLQVARAALA